MIYQLRGGPLDGREKEIPDWVSRVVLPIVEPSEPATPLSPWPDVRIELETFAIVWPAELSPKFTTVYYVRQGGHFTYVGPVCDEA